jgi:hypothetical protein
VLTPSAGSTPPDLWMAIGPLVLLVPVVCCMVDISRHPNTRQLPPTTWLLICLVGNVLGLAAYLRFGRSTDR